MYYKSPQPTTTKFSHFTLNPNNVFIKKKITPHNETTDDLHCLSADFQESYNVVIFSDCSAHYCCLDRQCSQCRCSVLFLFVDPFVEQWPVVNGERFLLIHTAVKQPQLSFCRTRPFKQTKLSP